jgi:hypothetical protein
VIELLTDAIDRFSSSNIKIHKEVRQEFLRAAMLEIYNLVDLAIDLRAEKLFLLGIERIHDNERREFLSPKEFTSAEAYIEYLVKSDEMNEAQEAVTQRMDAIDNALNKIGIKIGKVIPPLTWFKHGDTAFAVDCILVTTYDSNSTSWRLVIRKWDERNASR